jgi:hypothetical protein
MFTTASRGVLFIYSTPFFVALGAHWLFPEERLLGTKVVGLVVAFAGLALAFADGLRLPTRREVLGDVLQLVGALLWAATTLIIKARGQAVSPHRTLFLSGRHPRLRELSRLVLATHTLSGHPPARVHVLDAAVRGARWLAPAGRPGDPRARAGDGVRGAGDLPREPGAGRRGGAAPG